MSKQMVRVELTTLQTEGQVPDLILELQELVKGYGNTLDYEVETRYSWGDEYKEFAVYHNREETDEEYQGRLRREAYYDKMLEEKEKAEYERLTTKFKKPSF
jgi:hypothetical protein